MEKGILSQLEKLKPDKETVAELAGVQIKWIKYLAVSQTALALLNGSVLLAGALLYGKETLTILRKRMENQE